MTMSMSISIFGDGLWQCRSHIWGDSGFHNHYTVLPNAFDPHCVIHQFHPIPISDATVINIPSVAFGRLT